MDYHSFFDEIENLYQKKGNKNKNLVVTKIYIYFDDEYINDVRSNNFTR